MKHPVAPAKPTSPAPAALDAIAAAILDSKSPNTRRSYQSAWAAWAHWCGQNGHQALPGSPDGLALYLAERQAKGASMATLRMAMCAIAAAHDASGHPSPTVHAGIRAAMAGWARRAARAGKSNRQAKALDAEAVAAIRGHLGRKAQTEPQAALTMAICSVMADAGLRRSEAAALEWADVRREPDGSGRLTVLLSKTDQEGAGAVVAITPTAMQDLDIHAKLAHPLVDKPEGRVFGIGERQISRRIAQAARDAGLGDGYSGHSPRVGMAVRMTRKGAPMQAVQRQGRWASAAMVTRYTRNEAAGEALRYL